MNISKSFFILILLSLLMTNAFAALDCQKKVVNGYCNAYVVTNHSDTKFNFSIGSGRPGPEDKLLEQKKLESTRQQAK